jgi:hypothetical protein
MKTKIKTGAATARQVNFFRNPGMEKNWID